MRGLLSCSLSPPFSFVQKHGEWTEDIELRKMQALSWGAQCGGGDRPWTAYRGVWRSLATCGRRRRSGWSEGKLPKEVDIWARP